VGLLLRRTLVRFDILWAFIIAKIEIEIVGKNSNDGRKDFDAIISGVTLEDGFVNADTVASFLW